MDPKLQELLQARAQAEARLQEDLAADERAQLEARHAQLNREIGAKSQAPRGELERLREENAHFRQAEEERKAVEMAAKAADQLLGYKSQQEQDQEKRLQALIAKTLSEKLGLAPDTSLNLGTLVSAAQAGAKSQRTVPLETDLDGRPLVERDQDEAAKPAMGGKSAPAQHKSRGGEQPTLQTWMNAVARKDWGAIRDLQAACGLTVGAKALTEGGGANSPSDVGNGGALVPPTFSQELIGLLRANAVLRLAGARIVNMTSPQYIRARMSGAASATYVGEAQAIPLSQESFDQIVLNAKKLTALVPISNELLRDSSPSAEAEIKDDLAAVLALKEDLTFMRGAGTQLIPQGIFTRSDIQIVDAAGTNGNPISYDTMTAAIFALETANLKAVRRAWFMNPLLLQRLVNVKDDNGRPLFANYLDIQNSSLLPGGGDGNRQPTLLGMPIFTTTQLPVGLKGSGHVTDLALVEMSEVLIGNMEQMYMDSSSEATVFDGVNQINAFQSDLTVYRTILRHDITLMHPAAVVIFKDMVYA